MMNIHPENKDFHILVVDDEIEYQRAFSMILSRKGFHVLTCSDGHTALNMLAENEIDLVMTDLKMPGMDGIETLKKMKELGNNRSAGAPVIALTSNTTPNAKEEYINDGFKDYLSKPFKPEELEDMLFYYISPEKVRTVPIDLG